MRQLSKVVAGIAVTLIALVGFSNVAGAQDEYSPPEELEFDFPSQVQAGGTIDISGNCTIDGEDVNFTLGDVALGTVTPDDNGDFEASFTVPSSLAPGTYTLTGTCGELVATGDVQVLAAGQTPTTPGGTTGGTTGGTGGTTGGTSGGTVNTGTTPLARTGFDARPVATLGAAALVLGAAAVYGSRRRRTLV